jgi:hypothetical protein
MSSKTIRIAALGVPHDYRASLVPLIIEHLGYRIQWTSAVRADLVIYGSFYDVNAPRLRYLPRAWRSKAGQLVDSIDRQLSKRTIPPCTLFHTAENLRYDHVKADFAISHDLDIVSDRHFRLPYWMEVIDWSHEGLIGNRNPRYGELLSLERLQAPLGDQFLKRAQKAVLMSSHLREPRATCLSALQKVMPVDGMGPYFNQSIKDHHSSNFYKKDILQQYAFNLCPENGIYPGYVTEKIPEAFAARCLPVTYVDQSVAVDFNPSAFINLEPILKNQPPPVKDIFKVDFLRQFAEEPLLIRAPSILGLQKFVNTIVSSTIVRI